jgi:large subunit ribosomal protein L3
MKKMIKTIFGKKTDQTRKYNQEGDQIPVTRVLLMPTVVTQVKTKSKDGYDALQLGIGEKKQNRSKKPQQGHIKRAKLKKGPLYFREISASRVSKYKLGQHLLPKDVVKPGDLVDVTGISKGKGFTGAVKRWGFKTQPKTHGQSDRERAPGSIGQTTNPGRVHKGKKMPGRAGNRKTTVKNLVILGFENDQYLLVKGLVPGARNGLLRIQKVGKAKRFVSLLEKSKARPKKQKKNQQKQSKLKKEEEKK